MSQFAPANRINLLRGLVLALFGTGSLVFALTSMWDTNELVQRGRRTQGRVVSLYAGPSHPKIEFEDATGRTIVFPGNGFVSHRAGDRVGVLFRDDDPATSAVLDEPGALWLFDLFTGFLGCALILAGVYTALRRGATGGTFS